MYGWRDSRHRVGISLREGQTMAYPLISYFGALYSKGSVGRAIFSSFKSGR